LLQLDGGKHNLQRLLQLLFFTHGGVSLAARARHVRLKYRSPGLQAAEKACD